VAPKGLKQNCVGPLGSGTLYRLQNLIALLNGIVIRMHHANVHAEPLARFLGCRCLFLLVIVVLGWDRD
jgi:hypothetical protein